MIRLDRCPLLELPDWDDEIVGVASDWAEEHGYMDAFEWREMPPDVVRAALVVNVPPKAVYYPDNFTKGFIEEAAAAFIGHMGRSKNRMVDWISHLLIPGHGALDHWLLDQLKPDVLTTMVADCIRFKALTENELALAVSHSGEVPRSLGRRFYRSRNEERLGSFFDMAFCVACDWDLVTRDGCHTCPVDRAWERLHAVAQQEFRPWRLTEDSWREGGPHDAP